VIVRPTNIYGPRDYFDETAHVIPALIRKFTDGRDSINVFGGTQKREFLYVEDAARGMMAVAERGKSGEAYNLGTGGETQVTIAQLANFIHKMTGEHGQITWIEGAQTGDQSRSTDVNKVRALGWRHQVDLLEGLNRTVDWWLAQQ